MRYELKYSIAENQIYKIDKWLNSISNLRSAYKQRKVSSIYFDDNMYSSAQDNIDGISERKKYRLRWYNKNTVKNFYEIKIKKKRLSKKIIFSSVKEFNIKCIKNLFSYENRDILDKTFSERLIGKNLEPKLKVSYNRNYYTAGKIRITIDKNLEFSLFEDLKFNNKFMDNKIIMEIKFEEFEYADGLKLVNQCFTSPVRFSKYVRGLSLCGLANYY